MRALRLILGCAAGALVLLAQPVAALACACCTNAALRYVEVEPLSERRLAAIEEMRFAPEAKIASGEADPEIKGVTDPSADYRLNVTRSTSRIVFALRDAKGRSGTLVLKFPKKISIFEIDPRGLSKDEGQGPTLYKEWKLTADAAGDGLFAGIVGKGQKLTLILHGSGNGCTDASHFTDWTILIYGGSRLTLYGKLER